MEIEKKRDIKWNKAEKLAEGLPRNESESKKLADILKSIKEYLRHATH